MMQPSIITFTASLLTESDFIKIANINKIKLIDI